MKKSKPIPSVTLLGSFGFKRTENGNLMGEFSNNYSDFVMTESANPQRKYRGFSGQYDSTWFDTDIHLAKLEIVQKPGTPIFSLIWIINTVPTFSGEGFLYNQTLIGYYYAL